MDAVENLKVINKYSLDLSLWLDDYDDIYSDFDSRNYLKRRISSDFISELKMSLNNRSQNINDLILLLPHEKRNINTEQKITRNLINYFTQQLQFYHSKYQKNLKKGLILFIVAIIIMILNSVVSSNLNNNLLASIIRIVLEPSGWFLIWVAFDILYYDLKEIKKEKYFFRELAGIKIFFQASESYMGNE